MRLEAVTECEHGFTEKHGPTRVDQGVEFRCPGGSRRVASTTDLIEELKTRGAIVIESKRDGGGFGYLPGTVDPGRYLVFSLEGEK